MCFNKPTMVKDPPDKVDGSPIKAPPRECDHDFDFLYSEYEKIDGTFKENYKQIDVFHCRRCLEYKRVVVRDEDERYKPNWFKG